MSESPDLHFETLAVHAGMPDDDPHGGLAVPIAVASTYRVTEPGKFGRWAYGRSANPTRAALEEAITVLEGGSGGAAFASGLAAIDAVLRLLRPGDRVVVSNDVYGGTWRLLDTLWRPAGLDIAVVDMADLDAVAGAVAAGTGMLLVETPSNPALRVFDLEALAGIAHRNGCLLTVDNTFATPYLQRPLALGADLVVHSTTKYLGGHSDVIGGAAIAATPEHAERLAYIAKAAGAVSGPFDSFLVLRGLRTLAVRMERHCASASAIAGWLAEHALIAEVMYPGLESHPDHALCTRQMRMAGGMVSFRHAGGAEAAREMVKRTRVFALAISLGAVESLVEIPASMTHTENRGTQLEVPEDLVRLSVGLEHVDDLIADLDRALDG